MKNLPSFSFIPVTLIVVVIIILGPVISKQVAFSLIAILISAIIYEAFSHSQFKQMSKTYPKMTRRFWIINVLIYHFLTPIILLNTIFLGYRFLM